MREWKIWKSPNYRLSCSTVHHSESSEYFQHLNTPIDWFSLLPTGYILNFKIWNYFQCLLLSVVSLSCQVLDLNKWEMFHFQQKFKHYENAFSNIILATIQFWHFPTLINYDREKKTTCTFLYTYKNPTKKIQDIWNNCLKMCQFINHKPSCCCTVVQPVSVVHLECHPSDLWQCLKGTINMSSLDHDHSSSSMSVSPGHY